ncbi:MAG: hypothetical protein EB168_10420 [Euryarchaeota archaeon]|jgi:hypothetical protein|nr:hypothetical protein [Euryarchaeota archaeon]NDF22772.1 hypothetical protein [Euryarchaeota archaeon]
MMMSGNKGKNDRMAILAKRAQETDEFKRQQDIVERISKSWTDFLEETQPLIHALEMPPENMDLTAMEQRFMESQMWLDRVLQNSLRSKLVKLIPEMDKQEKEKDAGNLEVVK